MAVGRMPLVVLVWLAGLAACALIAAQGRYIADLSAFLPQRPSAEQQVLLDQLHDGIASRLILISLSGGDATARATASHAMARALRGHAGFVNVINGETVSVERDRAYLFDNRYLLSPAVTPARFSVEGLREAVRDSIDLIASPAGMMARLLLPRDPTGELAQLLSQLAGVHEPQLVHGVWASRDGARALLLIRTRAPGSDTDAQAHALEAIRDAFHAAAPSAALRLEMSGPGVFAVQSREIIRSEVHFLSAASSALIITLLWLVYRSFTALALGVLPVVSGVLAAVAAVHLGFGSVHGITLGFGTALIGEAVDYSIYLFVQSGRGGASMREWVSAFWPTVRLGVWTSIFGFAALLFSGFPGLAQLGLYAVTGLVTAALVTRFVLPHLMPQRFVIRDLSAMGAMLARLVARARALRGLALVVLVAACAVLIVQRATLWDASISSLNPLREADMTLDGRLRAELGAPDARLLVAVRGASRESVLEGAERVATVLQGLVDNGVLAAFDNPARYLPSAAAQRARQESLPAPEELAARLAQALQELPLSAGKLAPFLADVERARGQPLLQPADLARTSFAMALDALLIERQGEGDTRWSAVLPLTAPANGVIDAARVRAALAAAALADTLLVDIKAETDRLYSGYLREAIALSLGGLAALILLLLWALRGVGRVARVVLPLAAAVLTVTAGLALAGQALTLLHLVGLLLVVAVGSNYALFFDRRDARATATTITPGTLASMLLANATTVAGFGLLAISKVSVLQAVGITVAPGVVLALLYAAIFADVQRE